MGGETIQGSSVAESAALLPSEASCSAAQSGAGEGRVYRVQDRDGRGPYRPGLSSLWSDPDGPILPTIFEDFGDVAALMGEPGHYGCAFPTLDHLRAWFSYSEARKLAALGFSPVELREVEVIARAPRQLMVRRHRPLHRKARKLSWAEIYCVSPAPPLPSPLDLAKAVLP